MAQEVEPDDSGPVSGEVSSWDVNAERPPSTAAKLCKTESQNHMSPRCSAELYIWNQDGVIMALTLQACLPSHLFHSKMESRMQRRPRSTSMKDRQNSKAQSDRTSSMESECSPDSRLIAQVMCYPIFEKKFHECCLKCLEHVVIFYWSLLVRFQDICYVYLKGLI